MASRVPVVISDLSLEHSQGEEESKHLTATTSDDQAEEDPEIRLRHVLERRARWGMSRGVGQGGWTAALPLQVGQDVSFVRTRSNATHRRHQRFPQLPGLSAQELSAHGATLLTQENFSIGLRGVERMSAQVLAVCRQLSENSGLPSSCNLYCTPMGQHQGFEPHYDDHCVLVLHKPLENTLTPCISIRIMLCSTQSSTL